MNIFTIAFTFHSDKEKLTNSNEWVIVSLEKVWKVGNSCEVFEYEYRLDGEVVVAVLEVVLEEIHMLALFSFQKRLESRVAWMEQIITRNIDI